MSSCIDAKDSRALINVGAWYDHTIHEISQIVKEVVGLAGRFRFDASKPDGTPQKVLDVSRLKQLGWQPRVDLKDGIRLAYQDFLHCHGFEQIHRDNQE